MIWMNKRIRCSLFVWLSLCCAWVIAAASSRAQDANPLRLSLHLTKSQFLYYDYIPVTVILTSVSSKPEAVRLPVMMTSIQLEIVDSRTRQRARKSREFNRGMTGPRLRLQKIKKTKSSSIIKKGRKAASRPLYAAPVITLSPGESAQAQAEIVEQYYGALPVGHYLVRAVYSTSDFSLDSDWEPFSVVPLPEQEEKVLQSLLNAQQLVPREKRIEVAEDSLRIYPQSIFANRIRFELLYNACMIQDWKTTVRIGQELYPKPLREGIKEVVGLYWAAGLWHTGRQAEAENLARSFGRLHDLHTLIQERSQ